MPRSLVVGSSRETPQGTLVGAADAKERIEVSIYLKDTQKPTGWLSREALHRQRRVRLGGLLDGIGRFADQHGLEVTLADASRRLVKVAGSVEKLEAAFGTKLHIFEHEGRRFRARSGSLSIPTHFAENIEAVLGLDTRPIARPKIAFPRVPEAATGYLPNAVGALYDFPTTHGEGKGECIALIELGGGYRTSDITAAFAAMGISPPTVVAVPVSGGSNTPGQDQGADGEVALDIQVAGGMAPGAKIAVYFAPNTDQGFSDAISAAVHDAANAPSVLSISWGSAESTWTAQAITSMNSTFSDAATLKVTVCAAAGDSLATDGVNDGQAHVDFPASSPLVVGCGGTRIVASNNKLTNETVWNSDGGGTGGGVSALFALPDYQNATRVPVSVSTGKSGRGVPDVASDADPNSGYRIVVDGSAQIVGGTSAAAPLWAGMFALLNEAGGAVGQPHVTLYNNPSVFNDIREGNNKSGSIGYAAGPGWDACTGLGSPNGAALLGVFAAQS
jgi:kumamolisin